MEQVNVIMYIKSRMGLAFEDKITTLLKKIPRVAKGKKVVLGIVGLSH